MSVRCRGIFPVLFFSLILSLLLWGCGDDEVVSPAPAVPLVSGTVSGAGGELSAQDVILTVPAGALTEPTELAIWSGDREHPFDQDEPCPVIRLTGLPRALQVPLVLRIRYGTSGEKGDTLTVFRGEARQVYDAETGLYWEPIAARDSSGWCIVDLDRGPLEAGGRDGSAEIDVAVSREVDIWESDHFQLGHVKGAVTEEQVQEILLLFENARSYYSKWGFHWPDDPELWPMAIVVRPPVRSRACYVTAPHGRGMFQISPSLLESGSDLLPIVLHEMFHAVQTFYDPRDPGQWGSLNRERLWLDEATAAWVEAESVSDEHYAPAGMDNENYFALLGGLNGYSDLSPDRYGYGMASFIRYLVQWSGSCDDEKCVVDIYEHFAANGDVTDSLDEVLDPPVSSWCVDMQRRFVTTGIYPLDPDGSLWWLWPIDAGLGPDQGSECSTLTTVPDLGGSIVKFDLDQEPEAQPGTSVRVEAVPVSPPEGGESLPLAVYGRYDGSYPVLLAAGSDSLTVTDWPAICSTYDFLVILVSRPYSTAAGHTGSREIEVSARVMIDPSSVVLASLDNAVIEITTDNSYNGGQILMNQITSVAAAVRWEGDGFYATTSTDTFRLIVDPGNLALGDWYGSQRGETIGGSWAVRRIAGHGVPLADWGTNELIYRLQGGQEVCNRLTEVFESLASAPGEDPYRLLTGYSCHDNGTILDQSRIYIHLFRLE